MTALDLHYPGSCPRCGAVHVPTDGGARTYVDHIGEEQAADGTALLVEYWACRNCPVRWLVVYRASGWALGWGVPSADLSARPVLVAKPPLLPETVPPRHQPASGPERPDWFFDDFTERPDIDALMARLVTTKGEPMSASTIEAQLPAEHVCACPNCTPSLEPEGLRMNPRHYSVRFGHITGAWIWYVAFLNRHVQPEAIEEECGPEGWMIRHTSWPPHICETCVNAGADEPGGCRERVHGDVTVVVLSEEWIERNGIRRRLGAEQ